MSHYRATFLSMRNNSPDIAQPFPKLAFIVTFHASMKAITSSQPFHDEEGEINALKRGHELLIVCLQGCMHIRRYA